MTRRILLLLSVTGALIVVGRAAPGQFVARDPGVRAGAPGAGEMLPGLTDTQKAFFDAGVGAFQQQEQVADGLGPRFNLDSCAGCHSQPAIGGSSPAVNPQPAVGTAFGALNQVPSFITLDGPVREVRIRYKDDGTRDGGVHALFVISGRHDDTGDASQCSIPQEDFEGHVARNNITFRIPTPVFGGGLIEAIPDRAIVANRATHAALKTAFGIDGRPHRLLPTGNPNRNGNDGTIARFGWKAQNKSLLLFAGEAYNVEMGISNELFPSERDETATCQFAKTPNDVTNTDAATGLDTIDDIQKFSFFMRFLAPPRPSPNTPGGAASIGRGRAVFAAVGCALCHTPRLHTEDAAIPALAQQPVNLFSDLLLHRMGAHLADDIVQGEAAGDEFRTAPLWGLGQRIFLLHDGRTTDLIEAIHGHAGPGNGRYGPSEANGVVHRFRALPESDKQDLLNFLRSL